MSKLIKKAALFIVPFLVVFLLFFMLEPYDYFGLRGDATYLSKPLSAMRATLRDKPANIILGDSRMANLNTGYIEELTGERYEMLGFGGSSLGESIAMFWYATEHTSLEKVYFGVSFYTARGEVSDGRIPDVEKQADSVFNFVSNFNNWLEAINAAKYKTKNLLGGWLGRPDMLEYPEDPTQFTTILPPQEAGERYRKNLEDYAEIIRANLGDNWAVNPDIYAEMQKIIDYCDENGIELIFVFPPMQESLMTLVIEPLGYADKVQAYKDWYKAHATVYDLEFVNSFTSEQDNFYDGFHLMGERKKDLAAWIFTDVDSDAIVRYEK